MSREPIPSAVIHPPWEDRIPDEEWVVYHDVIRRARAREIDFAVGGAFATATYTGQLRNTKDFDLYLLPSDRHSIIGVMEDAGLSDHFARQSYDRSWIYRGSRGDIIVDAIWAMANHRVSVDQSWLSRGPEVSIRGERLRAIPLEELIWSKLYVLQRERCDWTDVLNLLDSGAEDVDWQHLLSRLEDDTPLLAGALQVFGWLVPDRLSAIPQPVKASLGLPLSAGRADPELTRSRADLLDSRPWLVRHMG